MKVPINDEDHEEKDLLKDVLGSTLGTLMFSADIEDEESYFKGKKLALNSL